MNSLLPSIKNGVSSCNSVREQETGTIAGRRRVAHTSTLVRRLRGSERLKEAAMRLAAALVARQRFLPGVTKDNGPYRACWAPIFAGPDAHLPGKLARAMPAAAGSFRCRNLWGPGDHSSRLAGGLWR